MLFNIKKSPNVLLIGPGISGGGAEKRFGNLCRSLFEGQIDVCVLANINQQEKINKRNFFNLKWKGKLSYIRIVFLMRKIILNGKYDAIFCVGFYPIILTWFSTRLMTDRPKLVFNEITRPFYSIQSFRSFKKNLYFYLRKTIYPDCDLFTANSIDGIKESIEHFNISENNAVRVPNIIREEIVSKLSIEKDHLHLLPHSSYFIIVTRLVGMKRADIAIKAISLIPQNIECKLLIVGTGPEKLNLEKKTAGLNVSHRVIFTGNLDNPFPLISKASALIITSEYEGFSNSVLEAMFCNVPVITSLCSSDAVDMCNIGAAIGYDVGDYEQLTKHMIDILNNPAISDVVVKIAKKYRSIHSINKAIPFYERLLTNLF